MGCSASDISADLSMECAVPVDEGKDSGTVVVTQREGRPLGLKFSIRGGRLHVRLIEDGAVADWNAQNPGQQVMAGDHIAAVNGESESMSKMLTHLHSTGLIHISFRKPPPRSSVKRERQPLLYHAAGDPHAPPPSEAGAPRREQGTATQLVELPFVSAANLGDTTCCICMENMDPDVRVMQLPCKHHFHLECAAQWLRRKGACPLCIRPLVLEPVPGEPDGPAWPRRVRTRSELGASNPAAAEI
mmetsp:Transcript_15716/g.40483  ORF Transcript_15716/g.40483 Transcript_15716/m.40483 type:complete len:245 (-) Transcript_15716:58-792(-)